MNTASTGLGNVWAMVVTAVTLPLLLHGLGPQAFGTWVLLQTFSAFTGWLSLADIGVGTAATKEIAERAAVGDRRAVASLVASTLVVLAVLGALFAALLATVGRWLLPVIFDTPESLIGPFRTAIVLFSAQTLADLLTSGSESCLDGLQRVDLSRGVDAIRRTLVAGATSAVALSGGGLTGVAATSLAASVLATAAASAALKRNTPRDRMAPSRADVRALFSYGKTVAVLRPLGVLHRTMDRLIVGIVLGPAAVALVEIAAQVQAGAESILAASSYAVIPTAPWLRARGDAATLRELLETGTKYSLLVTLPVVVVTAVLAGPLIRLWVGPGYEAAAGLVVWGLAYVAITAPMQVGSNMLLGLGRAGVILKAAGLALIVNLAASLILVQVVGIVGVFQATVLGTVFLVPILARSMLREVSAPGREFLRRAVVPVLLPTVALGASAGLVVALPLGDLVTVLVGALVGLGIYGCLATRFSMARGEVADLRRTVFGGG